MRTSPGSTIRAFEGPVPDWAKLGACYSLENLPEFEQNAVIGSPRSLAACASQGIEPLELVYRPLDCFTEAAGDRAVVLLRHDFCEARRQDLLLIAREALRAPRPFSFCRQLPPECPNTREFFKHHTEEFSPIPKALGTPKNNMATTCISSFDGGLDSPMSPASPVCWGGGATWSPPPLQREITILPSDGNDSASLALAPQIDSEADAGFGEDVCWEAEDPLGGGLTVSFDTSAIFGTGTASLSQSASASRSAKLTTRPDFSASARARMKDSVPVVSELLRSMRTVNGSDRPEFDATTVTENHLMTRRQRDHRDRRTAHKEKKRLLANRQTCSEQNFRDLLLDRVDEGRLRKFRDVMALPKGSERHKQDDPSVTEHGVKWDACRARAMRVLEEREKAWSEKLHERYDKEHNRKERLIDEWYVTKAKFAVSTMERRVRWRLTNGEVMKQKEADEAKMLAEIDDRARKYLDRQAQVSNNADMRKEVMNLREVSRMMSENQANRKKAYDIAAEKQRLREGAQERIERSLAATAGFGGSLPPSPIARAGLVMSQSMPTL